MRESWQFGRSSFSSVGIEFQQGEIAPELEIWVPGEGPDVLNRLHIGFWRGTLLASTQKGLTGVTREYITGLHAIPDLGLIVLPKRPDYR